MRVFWLLKGDILYKIEEKKHKAILIGVSLQKENYEDKLESLNELERLSETADIQCTGKFIQKRVSYHPATFAGKGFLQMIAEEMENEEADMLIFDNELSPTQGRNLTKLLETIIIDRAELILKIFHDHAKTKEARLQVELAELKYQLPRLKKLWSHLDRERGTAGGGAGTSRGMGEKQIEVDRRLIKNDIIKIEKKLKQIMIQHDSQRKLRDRTKKICLVGYTNAGKSTLFNEITGAGVLSQNKLFATLDSTARALNFGKGKDVILSDTIGFISNLPHHLVASFRATLKEVIDADLLLHVIDISDDRFEHYITEVNRVLKQIEADEIPQIIVFNKIDVGNRSEIELENLKIKYPRQIYISAKKGVNIQELLNLTDEFLNYSRKYSMLIPHTSQKDINHIHKIGKILKKTYDDEGLYLQVEVNSEDMHGMEKYILASH